MEADNVRGTEWPVIIYQVYRTSMQQSISLYNCVLDVCRLRRVEQGHSNRGSFRPRGDHSHLSDTLLFGLRLPVLVAIRGTSLAIGSAFSSSTLDFRRLRRDADGRSDSSQYASSPVRFGRQSALFLLRMAPIHGPIRDVQIPVDTDLLREPVCDVAKYRPLEISHAGELYYLRVCASDTSATSGAALLYSSLHLLSHEYEKAGKMADLFRIPHDFYNQLFTIFHFLQ